MRSQLWHEYNEVRAAAQFQLGEAATPGNAASGVLIGRLKELTTWLAEDVPNEISSIKKLIPDLRKMLVARYPKRGFLHVWPMDNPNSPPL